MLRRFRVVLRIASEPLRCVIPSRAWPSKIPGQGKARAWHCSSKQKPPAPYQTELPKHPFERKNGKNSSHGGRDGGMRTSRVPSG
jgi:hypothetical protein